MDEKEVITPHYIKTQQVFHKILSKLYNPKVELSILTKKNDNRIEGKVKMSKKLGLPTNVETDHEESETRSQEKNSIEKERTPSITEDKEEKPRQNRSNPLRNTIPSKEIIRTISINGTRQYRRKIFY